MHRVLSFPHRRAPMFRETIQGTELSERSQFFCGNQNAPLEIIERLELSASGQTRRGESLSFALDLFAVLLAQSVYDTKPEPKCIVIQDRAEPVRPLHAN